MEACDLVSILLLASLMDLLLGHTHLREIFVFALPLSLAIALYFTKRGRPEGFLQHFTSYHLMPRRYSAAACAKSESQRKRSFIHERA